MFLDEGLNAISLPIQEQESAEATGVVDVSCQSCLALNKKLSRSRQWNRFYAEKLINIDKLLYIISQYEEEKQRNLELQMAYDQRSREWAQQQEKMIELLHEAQPLRERVTNAEQLAAAEVEKRQKHEIMEESLRVTIEQLRARVTHMQSMSNPLLLENLQKKMHAVRSENRRTRRELEEQNNEVGRLKLFVQNKQSQIEKLSKKLVWGLKFANLYADALSSKSSSLQIDESDKENISQCLREAKSSLECQFSNFIQSQKSRLKGGYLETSCLPKFAEWSVDFDGELQSQFESMFKTRNEADDSSSDIEEEANQLEELLNKDAENTPVKKNVENKQDQIILAKENEKSDRDSSFSVDIENLMDGSSFMDDDDDDDDNDKAIEEFISSKEKILKKSPYAMPTPVSKNTPKKTSSSKKKFSKSIFGDDSIMENDFTTPKKKDPISSSSKNVPNFKTPNISETRIPKKSDVNESYLDIVKKRLGSAQKQLQTPQHKSFKTIDSNDHKIFGADTQTDKGFNRDNSNKRIKNFKSCGFEQKSTKAFNEVEDYKRRIVSCDSFNQSKTEANKLGDIFKKGMSTPRSDDKHVIKFKRSSQLTRAIEAANLASDFNKKTSLVSKQNDDLIMKIMREMSISSPVSDMSDSSSDSFELPERLPHSIISKDSNSNIYGESVSTESLDEKSTGPESSGSNEKVIPLSLSNQLIGDDSSRLSSDEEIAKSKVAFARKRKLSNSDEESKIKSKSKNKRKSLLRIEDSSDDECSSVKVRKRSPSPLLNQRRSLAEIRRSYRKSFDSSSTKNQATLSENHPSNLSISKETFSLGASSESVDNFPTCSNTSPHKKTIFIENPIIPYRKTRKMAINSVTISELDKDDEISQASSDLVIQESSLESTPIVNNERSSHSINVQKEIATSDNVQREIATSVSVQKEIATSVNVQKEIATSQSLVEVDSKKSLRADLFGDSSDEEEPLTISSVNEKKESVIIDSIAEKSGSDCNSFSDSSAKDIGEDLVISDNEALPSEISTISHQVQLDETIPSSSPNDSIVSNFNVIDDLINDLLSNIKYTKKWHNLTDKIAKNTFLDFSEGKLNRPEPFIKVFFQIILKSVPLDQRGDGVIHCGNVISQLLNLTRGLEKKKGFATSEIDTILRKCAHKILIIRSGRLRPLSLASLCTWFSQSCYFDYARSPSPLDIEYQHQLRSFLLDLLMNHKGMAHNALLSMVTVRSAILIRKVLYRWPKFLEKVVHWIAVHGVWIGSKTVKDKLKEEFKAKFSLYDLPEQDPVGLLKELIEALIKSSDDVKNDDDFMKANAGLKILMYWLSHKDVKNGFVKIMKELNEKHLHELQTKRDLEEKSDNKLMESSKDWISMLYKEPEAKDSKTELLSSEKNEDSKEIEVLWKDAKCVFLSHVNEMDWSDVEKREFRKIVHDLSTCLNTKV